jgi:hypothetical protein
MKMAKVKITNIGKKRVFTIPQADFTPGRKPLDTHPRLVTIGIGEAKEIEVSNGDPVCIVELEN